MALCERITFLKVPLDIVAEEQLEEVIRDLLTRGGQHQIVLLSLKGLMKARRNKEYRKLINNASLVIPISKGIIRGVRFLKQSLPVRWMPFEFIIRLLGILEQNQKSVYLLGAKAASINTAASNLRVSFPGLNIVGRCSGYYKREIEQNLLLAIKKASPSLLLVSNGIKGKEKWIYKQFKNFNDGIFLWDPECFDIFAGRKKRIPRETWSRGMEGLPAALKKPWRFFRGFLYLYYGLLLLIYRIRRKN